MLSRTKETLEALKDAGPPGDSLEFALLCFLTTSKGWMVATIPETAVVALPCNVGLLAAKVSLGTQGVFDFDRNFVASIVGLPWGKVALLDLDEIAAAHASEPWAAQDKIKRGMQIVLRAYFSFVAGKLPSGPHWHDVALGWLTRACDPKALVAAVTSTIVLQFFETLGGELDRDRLASSVAVIGKSLRNRIQKVCLGCPNLRCDGPWRQHPLSSISVATLATLHPQSSPSACGVCTCIPTKVCVCVCVRVCGCVRVRVRALVIDV
jgi:hypothetical protein